jgi:2-polyprenyl-3-methyl-5-hydroxy-6-metoxy-1,4-benzoquinol methylase
MALKSQFVDVACHVCSTPEPTKFICESRHLGLPAYVSICKGCGLVFLKPRWTKERYRQFYETEYDRYYRPQVLCSASTKTRYMKAERIWARISAYVVTSPLVMLDIGCGMGWTLDFLRRKLASVEIMGIEPSEQCAIHLQEAIGGQLLSNDVDSLWHIGNENRFDLIIMRHVLEHFLDPVSALHKVAHVLSAKGLLYIAVPDMMSPRSPLLNDWFRVVHTYYFSAPTLERTVTMAGLRPVVLQSEGVELWGVFQKGVHTPEQISVYHKQLQVIRSRLIRERWSPLARRVVGAIPMRVKELVPRRARRWLNKQLL